LGRYESSVPEAETISTGRSPGLVGRAGEGGRALQRGTGTNYSSDTGKMKEENRETNSPNREKVPVGGEGPFTKEKCRIYFRGRKKKGERDIDTRPKSQRKLRCRGETQKIRTETSKSDPLRRQQGGLK